MDKDIQKILITEEEIKKRVRELAEDISKEYKEMFPHLVCVLKGATVFLTDLIREMNIYLSLDYLGISSYGASTKSSGIIKITKDLDHSIEDRNVLIVEDIVDTGLTLTYLREILSARKPLSLKSCALLNKKIRRKIEVPVEYYGFEIPDEFVVGYGLDFNEKYRNLPYISVLKTEIYMYEVMKYEKK
ncbi:MAG: hypoxanthine phosphoribosyltransferase [Spirochaetes bacterium]|nr:hypoxanthine phosphoribosyltransferase [Spirochaetota bacterium]